MPITVLECSSHMVPEYHLNFLITLKLVIIGFIFNMTRFLMYQLHCLANPQLVHIFLRDSGKDRHASLCLKYLLRYVGRYPCRGRGGSFTSKLRVSHRSYDRPSKQSRGKGFWDRVVRADFREIFFLSCHQLPVWWIFWCLQFRSFLLISCIS